MGVHHWPGCNGNHPLGTGCNGGYSERMKEQMAENPYGLPEPPRPQPAIPENPYGLPEPRFQVRRPDHPKPRIIAVAQEDIPAGAEVEIDMSTGLLRRRT